MTIEQNANKVNDCPISLDPLKKIVSNDRKITSFCIETRYEIVAYKEERSRYLYDERADLFIFVCNDFVTIYLLFQSGDTLLGAMQFAR